MLQPCTIKNQVQQLVFSSAASLVWNIETNNLFGPVTLLHRWEWWCFSHCRRIWVTLGSSDLWLEVKLKYRSERSVSGKAGRISYYPFSSPNLGLFFYSKSEQNLKTYWHFPENSYWNGWSWNLTHFWTIVLKSVPSLGWRYTQHFETVNSVRTARNPKRSSIYI